MIHAIADTHTFIWHLFDSSRLSQPATRTFDVALNKGLMIGLSAVSIVEIVYLIEKGRIPGDALPLLNEKLKPLQQLFEVIPVTQGIAEDVRQIPYLQVPDMPDRIIAATALHYHVPLISHDGKIRMSPIQTIW
jgi:PIN domain nuclease of toxin-antitoxin system